MVTVTFPTGIRVTYNDAQHIQWWDAYAGCYLREKKDGTVIASVSLKGGAILEWRKPCEITAPPVSTVKSALQLIVNELNRALITGREEEHLLRDLKTKLARFDARKKCWRS